MDTVDNDRKRVVSSDELLEFYKAWLEWALGEAKDGPMFNRTEGLCRAIFGWAKHRPDENLITLLTELKLQFIEMELDSYYPFGKRSYQLRMKKASQHKHEVRLDWVRSRIADNEVEKLL